MSADLHHLYLGHLSRQCNRPDLARGVMQERLQKIGANHVRLELTSQTTPCPTVTLGGKPAEGVQPQRVDGELSRRRDAMAGRGLEDGG